MFNQWERLLPSMVSRYNLSSQERGTLLSARKGWTVALQPLQVASTTHPHPSRERVDTHRNGRDCSTGFSIGINVDPSLSPLPYDGKGPSTVAGTEPPSPKGLLIDFRSSSFGPLSPLSASLLYIPKAEFSKEDIHASCRGHRLRVLPPKSS